ncbi:ATP-binding protein [Thermococcus sp. GR7]|uniref:ATP-binding protein n=1 Tax=unclassified Thermococcus TaxID=2627626 RepID=UPI001430E09E|nr:MULTISPECIES: ATP-binding protein [unclassified Thermococcus]NJE45924.1 ATP-binding protein [Thermococcus sp. GR7]NJE78815.1 ATP-binding protein [Thermococcus sp. GR4]NJF22119.1 ATP-binding protein [Thermococcus sp. GR5]
MKFYDREREIELLRRGKRIAIIGRRRVGKTRLVEEALNPITLFIPAEKNEALICRDWIEEIRERRYIPTLNSMKEIVEFLMREGETIFIDELQNALRVNPSFLYDLQRLLDKYRDAKLVVTGSLISMSKKLVEDYQGPLYGRFDYIIKLRELGFGTVTEIMRDLGYSIEDAVVMWAVFGGSPKYYETLERFSLPVEDFIRMMFFEEPYPMFPEVLMMLKEELGKEYKTYFSILQAISEGKNTLGEISSYLSVKSTSLTKYLAALEREYELVTKRKDVFERGRNRYYITQNLVDFWFRFLWRNYSKLERNELSFDKNDFNAYVGRKFESLVELLVPKLVPFEVIRTGKLWGKFKGKEKGKDSFEIDVVALGREDIAFFEVKWEELSFGEAKKELKLLSKKAEAVGDKRRIHLVLVAKRIGGKERLWGMVYDLEDLNEMLAMATHRLETER